jgi:HSP20 family protein
MTVERWCPVASMNRLEPFRILGDIQSEMNRPFDGFFGEPTTTAGPRAWAPASDMYETADDLVLSFELPGIREKDVSLSIAGDLLTLESDRASTQELKEENYYHLERVSGKFVRSVPLPVPVHADRVKAAYRNGVLEVKLPKEIKVDIL